MVIYISEKYLKENTNLPSTIDSKIIKPNLFKAQAIYITKFIGEELDTRLQNAILNSTLTDIENSLLQKIRRSQVEYTAYLCYADILFRFDNKSANAPNSESGNAMLRSDLNYMRDIAINQAEFFLNEVKLFLINNKVDFPEFNKCKCNGTCRCSGSKSAFTTKIVFD